MQIDVVEYKGRKSPKSARRAPKRAKQGKSLSKLKKELDSAFSKLVRKGATRCFTCGKPGTEKNLQCGHFVPRQYLATRWEFDNCRPQCVGCNIWGKGQILEFEEHLKEELGSQRVEFLKESRKHTLKLNREFYQEKIAFYQEKLSTSHTL